MVTLHFVKKWKLMASLKKFGSTERIMVTLHFVKKGKLMASLEKFYTHSRTTRNNQIDEESTTGCNKNLRYCNTT